MKETREILLQAIYAVIKLVYIQEYSREMPNPLQRNVDCFTEYIDFTFR